MYASKDSTAQRLYYIIHFQTFLYNILPSTRRNPRRRYSLIFKNLRVTWKTSASLWHFHKNQYQNDLLKACFLHKIYYIDVWDRLQRRPFAMSRNEINCKAHYALVVIYFYVTSLIIINNLYYRLINVISIHCNNKRNKIILKNLKLKC